MIKTLAGYDVDKDISNNLIFALKMSLLSERRLMTVVIKMHKTSFIFICHDYEGLTVKCYPMFFPSILILF